MSGHWTDPARDDIAAYDPEDIKHPDYLERITDQETNR